MAHEYAPPPSKQNFYLPRRLKICIADAITTFSKIDQAITEIRWSAEGAVTFAEKKKLAKARTQDNITAIREIVSRNSPAPPSELFWGALSRLQNDRNIVGHGVWWVDENNLAWTTLHSKFLEDDETIVSEAFPYERFEQMIRIANFLLQSLLEFRERFEQAQDETN